MALSDGQAASAAVFNAEFVSKVTDSTVVSKLGLNRSGSGSAITDAQQQINTNKDDIATNAVNISTNTADIATNTADIAVLQGSLPLSNFAATADPIASNDLTEGYSIGSLWLDNTNDRAWIALDVTEDAAIWKRIDKRELAVSAFLSLDMSSDNLDDASYVELIADTGADVIKRVQSFYPPGSLAYIAIGAAASEVNNFILTAGGNGEVGIDVNIPANSRLSIKLLSGEAAVTSGTLVMNLFSEV